LIQDDLVEMIDGVRLVEGVRKRGSERGMRMSGNASDSSENG
jgi:hypothetical protein